jgi:hypothetical protein
MWLQDTSAVRYQRCCVDTGRYVGPGSGRMGICHGKKVSYRRIARDFCQDCAGDPLMNFEYLRVDFVCRVITNILKTND